MFCSRSKRELRMSMKRGFRAHMSVFSCLLVLFFFLSSSTNPRHTFAIPSSSKTVHYRSYVRGACCAFLNSKRIASRVCHCLRKSQLVNVSTIVYCFPNATPLLAYSWKQGCYHGHSNIEKTQQGLRHSNFATLQHRQRVLASRLHSWRA